MRNVINHVEASKLFVAVKKLGIEEKLSMELACMAMKQKLDRYQQKVWENHDIIAAALLDPYEKGSMLDERTKKVEITYIRGFLPSPPPTSSSTFPASTPISSTTSERLVETSLQEERWTRTIDIDTLRAIRCLYE